MSTWDRSNITREVEALSAQARVKVPRIRLRQKHHWQACANALLNRITIDMRLLAEMPWPLFRALLAHEVGHLRTRRRRVWEVLREIAILVAAIGCFGVMAVYGRHDLVWPLPGAFWLAEVIIVLWLCGKGMERWETVTEIQDEMEADAFAASVCGSPAMGEALRWISAKNYGGNPGPITTLRLRALQNADL